MSNNTEGAVKLEIQRPKGVDKDVGKIKVDYQKRTVVVTCNLSQNWNSTEECPRANGPYVNRTPITINLDLSGLKDEEIFGLFPGQSLVSVFKDRCLKAHRNGGGQERVKWESFDYNPKTETFTDAVLVQFSGGPTEFNIKVDPADFYTSVQINNLGNPEKFKRQLTLAKEQGCSVSQVLEANERMEEIQRALLSGRIDVTTLSKALVAASSDNSNLQEIQKALDS